MIDILDFERKKNYYRPTIQTKINKLLKVKHVFIDDDFKVNNFMLSGETCFTIINKMIDFNLLYPTLEGLYQLSDYLIRSTFILEGYELLKHTVIYHFSYLYSYKCDKSEYLKIKALGYRYEHGIYLLTKSTNIFEYEDGIAKSRNVGVDLVSKDIPYNSYINELKSFNLDYYFVNDVDEHINLFINNALISDVKFIKANINTFVIENDVFDQFIKIKEKDKGINIINKVIDVSINDKLEIHGIVLGNYKPSYNCYIKINNKNIINYKCECKAYETYPNKFCKHLVATYLKFYQIACNYFNK